jgi:hypothetical protein
LLGIMKRGTLVSHRAGAIAAAIAGLLALGGCATADRMADQAIEANRALDLAANQLTLLNIARAAAGMPLQFSRISQMSGPMNNLYLNPSLQHVVNPGVAANPTTLGSGALGFDRPVFVVQPMDDQESMQGLMRQTDLALTHLIFEGAPAQHKELALQLLIESASLESDKGTERLESKTIAKALAAAGFSSHVESEAIGPKITSSTVTLQQLAVVRPQEGVRVAEDKKTVELTRPSAPKLIVSNTEVFRNEIEVMQSDALKKVCPQQANTSAKKEAFKILSAQTAADVTPRDAIRLACKGKHVNGECNVCLIVTTRSTPEVFQHVGAEMKVKRRSSPAAGDTVVTLTSFEQKGPTSARAFTATDIVVRFGDAVLRIDPTHAESHYVLQLLRALVSLRSKATEPPAFFTIRQN